MTFDKDGLNVRCNRVLCGLVAVLVTAALAGCGSSVKGGSPTNGRPQAGDPPPGGWPQPENGRLTEKMCGLLTDDDYEKFGHERLGVLSQKRIDNENAVDCLYQLNDDLNLNLQPTAVSAALTFAGDLKDHKQRLAQAHHPSILATNVVPGSDQSWFDHWSLWTGGQGSEYEVEARRGSLLLDIVLGGTRGRSEQPPREVLTGLAGLVLQRIPNVGRTDTGTTHEVTYAVSGARSAAQIVYSDPTTQDSHMLTKVRLPWHLTRLLVVPHNQSQVDLSLNAVAPAEAFEAPIGCQISIDGKMLIQQRSSGGVSCTKFYTPSG